MENFSQFEVCMEEFVVGSESVLAKKKMEAIQNLEHENDHDSF